MKKFLLSLVAILFAALPLMAADGGTYTPNVWVFTFTNAAGAVSYTGTLADSFTNIFTAKFGPIRQRSIMLQLDAASGTLGTTNVIAYAWSTDGVSYGPTSLTNIISAAGLKTTLVPLSTLGAGYFSIVGITNSGAGGISTNGTTLRIPLNYNAP